MKKAVLLCCSLFLLCGCNNEKEEVIYTCKQDSIASTYSAAFSYVVKTIDGKGISSIESTAIYTASYEDTDFSNVISVLKGEQKKYEDEYTEAKIDLDVGKQQIFFNVIIPINNHNLLIFKDSNSDLVENGNLSMTKYKEFLESNGYTCN